ncbi:hypothetical protein FACS1894199_18010 [Bacteroidia bacterium]|nr:hypothetical protein FACS1894199_18010 [Bacteroidia bacterium]
MKTIYFSVIACLFLLSSCEEKSLEPTSKSLGKPGSVVSSTVTTTPIAGGVVVKYRVPDAEDILEVRAVYTLSNGQEREESASFYANQLTLKGFNDTTEHEALLYVVNRAQEKSDPVSVKFRPLESSLSKAAKTVEIVAGYGGANFSWKNEDRAVLYFDFRTEDATGTLQSAAIISSDVDSSTYNLNGYLVKPRKFGLVISDNWGNASDVIVPAEGLLTPIADKRLDKKKMKIMILPQVGALPGDGRKGDVGFYYWSGSNENLLDDDPASMGHSNSAVPGASLTLDLGVFATMSRIVLHQRTEATGSYAYTMGNPKTFSIYGYSSETPPSGDWSEWTKMADFEMIKPSGLPTGQRSDEDNRAMVNGHEFPFMQAGNFPVRYLRLVINSTWGSNDFTCFNEITCYGGYDE